MDEDRLCPPQVLATNNLVDWEEGEQNNNGDQSSKSSFTNWRKASKGNGLLEGNKHGNLVNIQSYHKFGLFFVFCLNNSASLCFSEIIPPVCIFPK
jgi:hypothetical protein